MSGKPEWRVFVRNPRRATAGGHGDGATLVMIARLRHPGGRVEEQSLSAETLDRDRAELLARAWQRKLNGVPGTATPGGPGRLSTVLDVVDLRIADLERDASKSPLTLESFAVARKRLATELGALPVAEVGRAAVLRLQDRLRDQALAAVTINDTLNKIGTCWRWAHERELVAQPWPKVRKLARGPERKRPYQDREVVALVEWVREHAPMWHPIVALLADTGRRVGAIVTLRGRDVDRAALVVTVRDKGRGGKQVAQVPVTPETMALLPQAAPDAYVFPSRGRNGRGVVRPDEHLRAQSVNHVIRRGIEALGIPDGERLDTHSLRRAFVSAAERAGVPDDVGRRVTGHRTRAMWDHYQAQAIGDDLHGVVRKVRERRWGSSARVAGEVARPAPPPVPPPEPAANTKPAMGFEPIASALRKLCSTVELGWRS